ncbi:hypothetical protein BHM03_00031058, partial [Ensete ventricosum]
LLGDETDPIETRQPEKRRKANKTFRKIHRNCEVAGERINGQRATHHTPHPTLFRASAPSSSSSVLAMAISAQIARIFPGFVVPSGVRYAPGARPSLKVRCDGGGGAAIDQDFDKKAFRHTLTRSDNYNRRGFGHKKETLELMNQEYTSKTRFCWNFAGIGVCSVAGTDAGVCDVIKTLKENNNEYTWGNVTVKLAEAYGFCWGVERAVQIAYEARKQFPEERIWVTNEIIHNPTVNKVWNGCKLITCS